MNNFFILLLVICQVLDVSADLPFYMLNVSGPVYMVSQSVENYQEASNYCVSYGLVLATFNANELNNLKHKFYDLKSPHLFFKTHIFWINYLQGQQNHKCKSSGGRKSPKNQCCPVIKYGRLGYNDCSYSSLFLCQCEHNCTEIYKNTTDEINESDCTCQPGFVPASDDNCTCVDEDECLYAACDHNCTNTVGSYICECSDGFRLNATDNSTCEDVNECVENSTLCEEECSNEMGSFLCYCPLGYKLAEDGRSCEKSQRFKSCGCYCSQGSAVNISELLAEAQASLGTENKTEAIRYKRSLSSFRRTATCAVDERKEASAVGSLGIVMIVLCVCAITASDVVNAIFFVVKKIAKKNKSN